MAAVILPLAPPLATQYALAEADRLAILAQAPSRHRQPSAVTNAEVERQRLEFIAMHGCVFGTLPDENQ
ncbi:hypothetical protein [Cupriavidus pinatubonensis]|uniref:Uncharacterized protein n=1 Tax=Cupriavidus pinatubonensis TaxID=248026 RepID=A0ABN7YDV8_9BURK|nr:hypothetical protein [Cupriavidus pinatubonensis]CAG9170392.1 hypothetical protein LMG23994_01878 [Cupriavidus pinatubonensis]